MTAVVIVFTVVVGAVVLTLRRALAGDSPIVMANRVGLAVLGVGVFVFAVAGFTENLSDSLFHGGLLVGGVAVVVGAMGFVLPLGDLPADVPAGRTVDDPPVRIVDAETAGGPPPAPTTAIAEDDYRRAVRAALDELGGAP